LTEEQYPVWPYKRVHSIALTKLIQKNCKLKSQLILCDADKPDLYVVAAFLRLAKHAKELGQSPDAPLVVYASKGGVLRDLINAELLKCIKSTAAAAFMHLSLE
jgi:hypothetical protein